MKIKLELAYDFGNMERGHTLAEYGYYDLPSDKMRRKAAYRRALNRGVPISYIREVAQY